jgi:hypothetical protein
VQQHQTAAYTAVVYCPSSFNTQTSACCSTAWPFTQPYIGFNCLLSYFTGVILVYDLTNRKTLARLSKWAAEITQYGSFVAPLAEEVAARNIGGLPVPVLVRGSSSCSSCSGCSCAVALLMHNLRQCVGV